MRESIRVLLVEDNPGDAFLLRRFLEEAVSKAPGLPRFDLVHVRLLSEGLKSFETNDFHIALLDLSLPDSRGIETFEKVHSKVPSIPIIVLTGYDDERLAVEIVRKGAQDYLVKGHIDGHLLVRAIRYAIERQRIEEALRRSEGKNRALLHAIPDLMLRISSDGTIIDSKPSNELTPGVPVQEMIGKKARDVFPFEVAELTMNHVRRALETNELQRFEFQILIDGEMYEREARFVVSGEQEILAIIRDITERKRLEKEILEISGNEQRRIGQDLHDGLGQHLTGIAFISKGLEEKLAAKSLPETSLATKIVSLMNKAISHTRDLARGLYPVQLKTRGLASALEELASSTETMFSVSCAFEATDAIELPGDDTEIHLYRIAQESVNNAIKHGQAKKIRIQLNRIQDFGVLTITSDGLDFPEKLPEKRGMGLSIMRYRANMIHGSLEVKKPVRGGTQVICSFPYLEKETSKKNGKNKKNLASV
jgi:PAS domain S-box-containing protein